MDNLGPDPHMLQHKRVTNVGFLGCDVQYRSKMAEGEKREMRNWHIRANQKRNTHMSATIDF